jgi:hypothetical protein
LAFGKVFFYIPGTSTPKTTWADEALTTANTNPVTLDAGGEGTFWGAGFYRQVVQRANGTQVWDEVTGFDGSGGTGGGNVSGPPVSVPGHVVIWASTSGDEIADGGALGALASLNSVNNSNWSGLPLTVPNGGTSIGTAPSNGQLLIGNGIDYTLSTLTAGSGVTITNAPGSITVAFTGGGSGTVTSVSGSGGTTGLTLSGGPITGAGTLTLGGTLAVANGGTGATTASADRTALGAEPSGQVLGINNQTGDYILALGDAGQVVTMTLAIANIWVIPPNSAVAFPVKTRVDGAQLGAGQTTITPGGGVTIHAFAGALKSGGQYAGWTALKIGTDEWVVFGNLTT